MSRTAGKVLPFARPALRRGFVLWLLAGLTLAAVPAAAETLYPNGKAFNCNFRRANGTTGTATVKLSLSGSLVRQTGTLINQVTGATPANLAVELSEPRWEGDRKVWTYVQTRDNIRCKLSVWGANLLWENCSNGNSQHCTEQGASQQKIGATNALLTIKGIQMVGTDHEGWPRGESEIDLFLADHKPCSFGWCYEIRSSTRLIFDGVTRTDEFGNRYTLPKVTQVGKMYEFPPVYVPFELGMGLVLVEDDKARGTLYLSNSSPWAIGVTCKPSNLSDPAYKASIPIDIGPCKDPIFSGRALLALLGAGDDLFKEVIAVTHAIDMGQDFLLETREWRIKVSLAY